MLRILTFLLLLLVTAGWCQEAAETPAPIPTPVEAIAETYVDEGLSTPEASLRGFMEVMRDAGPLRPDLYLTALRHLDLTGIPAMMRDERGVTLAKKLFFILSQTKSSFRVSDESPVDDEVTLYRQGNGESIVLKKQPDGRWLFSADSMLVVPNIYRALTTASDGTEPVVTWLDLPLLGIKGSLWLILIGLPLLSYLVGALSVLLLRISVGRFATIHYNISVERQKLVTRPMGWLVACLIFWIGLCLLDVPNGLLLVLAAVVKVAATLAGITVAFRLADAASVRACGLATRTHSPFDDMLVPLARRSFKVLVGTLGVLFLAQNLDIEVWSLFAGFSVFGAMVALAGQDTVKNFFGSLTVLGDRPFGVGDWIVVEGIEGVVEDLGFRSTRIRTFYDSLITLPNSRLITASVDNYGRRNYRRYTKKLAVRWSTSPDKLESFCEGIRELVRRHPYTRKDSYQVWVNDVGDYALEILIYIFFLAPDWGTELRERHRFLIDVHRLANDLGVELAYPSQQLMLSRPEKPTAFDFDQALQERAVMGGRGACGKLLDGSLPKEKPGPLVLDQEGRWQ